MPRRETLLYGLYAAIIAVILALTGIFSAFAGNIVITDPLMLRLSTVILVLMTGGTGYLVSYRVRDRSLGTAIVNGAVGSGIVGLGLALLVFLTTQIPRETLTFIFQNLGDLTTTTLMFGQEDLLSGLLSLLVFSLVIGSAAGLAMAVPDRERNIISIGLLLTVITGLLQGQITEVMTPMYAGLLVLAFVAAFVVNFRFVQNTSVLLRAVIGGVVGLAAALLILSAAGDGVQDMLPFDPGTSAGWIALIAVVISAGGMGALSASASRTVSSGILYFVVGVLVLAVMNWQGEMNLLAAAMTFLLLSVPVWFAPILQEQAAERFSSISRREKRTTTSLSVLVGLVILIVLPLFVGQNITNILDRVGLYIVMGIGLNIMVGFAGLLDLGFVASFAIGAYTVGLLTTPSMVTCGWTPPSEVAAADVATLCTGIMPFWQAWPLAALFAGLTGAMLGVPVLRLRGDYLAIVTLGFGEIINRLVLSSTFKDLLGGAQGISPIPVPVVDLRGINESWYVELGSAQNIYYLILPTVLVTAFVVYRLSSTRLGRAWRSIKADEDVAEAMGIHLVRNKLLAFGISSALAGAGGAIFGAWLQSIFPSSFTLMFSINVLSMIIIGGLGSIAGVVVGSMILIGMPEVLREIQDYRLLVFGVLLVVTMLLKPEGLIPYQPPKLSERVLTEEEEAQARERKTQEPEVNYG